LFEALTRSFQFRFKDRITAANILGEALKDTIKKEEIPNVIVVGIPRGGVLTADIVARKLFSRFDIVIPRKLTDPDNKEQAIGAIMEDGATYLDEQLIRDFQISSEYLEKEKLFQLEEIKRRTSLFLGDALTREHYFEKKIVILVDEGAATGATIIAAARSIKKRFRPKRLIIALPVAPKDTVKLLKQEADRIEVVSSPSANFHSVGQYYQDFNPVSDGQVIKILQDRGLLPKSQ
jgi:putative phosphoribosyl transferase